VIADIRTASASDIRDQIALLTGRRFLEGYADDEAQFRALMDNGATVAQALELHPGVELSPDQMAQLTSDIVWLVTRTVTAPDGSTVRALVPQVYVAVREGDIDGTGTLISANAIDLTLGGDLSNSGTIAGRQLVQVNSPLIDLINNIEASQDSPLRQTSCRPDRITTWGRR
jgi:filamentous hemagglutinin